MRGGLGFRALQAKRAGLAFDDVILGVKFDDCSQQIREREQRWPSDLGELELDYIERYSYETADVQRLPDGDVADPVRGLGWGGRAAALDAVNKTAGPNGRPAALPSSDSHAPLVTVGIAHYNLGHYLPATLASLATQSYSNLDVLVIDDGSTDRYSIETFAELEGRYPTYRFLRQQNAGIGATRNRCLTEARGEFFIPMDADNLARPDMVERFVTAIRRNHQLSAMTCYHLAFAGDTETAPEDYLYACRPTGGPHTMASIRNVYGDANAIFRTADFRAVGGYETDRGTSCEDWEAFVKLIHAGKRIDVIPDYLFYYRHREAGFSRVTNWFANHERVLRQFKTLGHLPAGEAAVLWTALLGFQQRVEQLTEQQQCLRYRLADRLHAIWSRVPVGRHGIKQLVRSIGSACHRLAGRRETQAESCTRTHSDSRMGLGGMSTARRGHG
ncbi:MAG: epsH 3 [Gemmataceae bacterium]|nr:epsH 3 [Gemmataceae bacterium]